MIVNIYCHFFKNSPVTILSFLFLQNPLFAVGCVQQRGIINHIQIFRMVDCDLFTDFNKELTIESGRLLLEFKKCDYNLQLAFPYSGCRKIPKDPKNSNFKRKVQIKAVYGIIEMEENSYLVVVTKASLMGQIFHRKIFQVLQMEYFCLAEKQSERDRPYLAGLQQLFSSRYWYFSDEYDLTNSLQQFVNSKYSLRNKRLEYMYNSDWIDDFLKLKAYEWITGFISGFIEIRFTHVGTSSSCEVALITRRDKRRQGKRWIVRGCDLDGNSANTAETEMVLLAEQQGKEHFFSHVQLRGSMPFIWKQSPDMKWSPKVTIHPSDKLNSDIIAKNYADIKKNYENCTLVNLIDKKGSQKRLGDYFEKMHSTTEDEAMKLVWFDFHAQCKNMKYENLSKLLDQLQHQIDNYGYFYIEMPKGDKDNEHAVRKNAQKGIFRTNCMDCLDRTNVVQSVFARQLMLAWLNKLGIVNRGRGGSAFEKLPDSLQEIFRSHWTKNADAVSILYSGTPAMKTDFTATGKRTTRGALNDGYFGTKRWFLGNFYDARDQDYIDFSLGKIKPKKSKAEIIRHSACNALYVLVFLIIITFFMLGEAVDSYLTHQPFTIHWKLLAGILGTAGVLFLARMMKGVFVRQPIKAETHL